MVKLTELEARVEALEKKVKKLEWLNTPINALYSPESQKTINWEEFAERHSQWPFTGGYLGSRYEK